ncbi:hypothetical protein Tco_0967810 [Tanacetum coccineum]
MRRIGLLWIRRIGLHSIMVFEHQSDTKVFTMTMEILPELTSNKLCGREINTTSLKSCQGDSSLKIKLPDHRSNPMMEEVKSSGLTTMGDLTFEQLMDEYEKKKGADKEECESLYDTESDIKYVKSFSVTTFSLIEEEADPDLHSMPDDEVESVFGFEAAKSTYEENDKAKTKVELTQSEEATANNILDEITNLNAFANKPSDLLVLLRLKYHLSPPKMPDLLADTFKNLLPQIIEDSIQQTLPKFNQRVQETLKAHVLELISKPPNKELNALNTLESRRFDTLQTELMTTIRAKVGKSIRKSVGKEMQIVQDRISYCATQLEKGDVHLRELINLLKDMVFLLDSTKVFEKVKVEGEKASLEEDMELELAEEAKTAEEAKANAHGEPQPINTTSGTEPTQEAKAEVQREQSFEQAPPMSTAMVVQTSEEEPPVKKIKFNMPEYVPDFTIPSPTPLNSVMSQNIRPPVIINNILFEQYTTNLFSSSSSEFSLIPPPKITDDKGKGKADEDDSTKKLIPLLEESRSSLKLLNLNQFSASREGQMSIEEFKA